MTIAKLASELAKREGKKSQSRIGDVREILGHLSDLMVEEDDAGEGMEIVRVLMLNGTKRAKKKK